jgi:tetratricopeptide (TPR) repeat protein
MTRILFFIGALLAPIALHAQCNAAVQRLVANRQYDNARVQLEAQIKRAPNDDAAMHCMGRLLLEQDESGDAIDWLEKAVKINGRDAQHHLWLGLALRTEGGKAGMLRAPGFMGRMKTELEQALVLDPRLVEARYALLQLYAQAPAMMGGSMPNARAQAAQMLKVNPMRGHIGYAFIADQEKDYPAAEKEYLAAIAARPDSDVTYSAAGAFYRRRERWSDAISMYEKQLKTISKDAWPTRVSNAHYFLGLAHEKSGHRDRAKAEYQAAIAANPKNEDAKKAFASLN